MFSFPFALWQYPFVSATANIVGTGSFWSGVGVSVSASATASALHTPALYAGVEPTVFATIDGAGYATVAVAGWNYVAPAVSGTQEGYIPPGDPSEGRSGFANLLVALRERLSQATDDDTSRVHVVLDPERVPFTIGDWDLLLVPGGESDLPAIDGGGRYVNLRSRDVQVVVRSRDWSDRRETDAVALTDTDKGHLILENAVMDVLELWTPTTDAGATMLALPVEAGNVSAPARSRSRNQGWTSSKISLSVSYLRNLTLPEATTPPSSISDQTHNRANFEDILAALRARISSVCLLDFDRVLISSLPTTDIPHTAALQEVIIGVDSESPQASIDGGGRYVNLRKRRIRLTVRTRGNLDEVVSDLVKLTDANIGHFAMEDRLCDAVELWIALDDPENALCTPITTTSFAAAEHDSSRRNRGLSEWISSRMDLETLYLRDLTLDEV